MFDHSLLVFGFQWPSSFELSSIPLPILEDPAKYHGNFKQAFLDATAEFNSFGASLYNSKLCIDDSTALFVYGLHVARLNSVPGPSRKR